MKNCSFCGEPFEPSRVDVIFCSSACKQKNYRLKSRATSNGAAKIADEIFKQIKASGIDPKDVALEILFRQTVEQLLRYNVQRRHQFVVRLNARIFEDV